MKLIQVLPIGWSGGGAAPDLAEFCAGLAAELRVPCELVAGPFDPSPARHPERLQYHSTELLARMEQLFRQRSPRVRTEAEEQLPVAGSPSTEGLPEAEGQLLAAGGLIPGTAAQDLADNRLPSTVYQSPATNNRSSSPDSRFPSPASRVACPEPRIPNPESRLLGVTSLDLYIPTLTFVFGEAQLHGPCAVVSVHRLRQEFYGLPRDPRLAAERLLKEAVHELGHTLGLRHCDDYRCAMAPSHAVEWIDLKSSRLCPDCQSRAASAL
jgi:predicted Zn-dependent protease